jgi:hypothetical protein
MKKGNLQKILNDFLTNKKYTKHKIILLCIIVLIIILGCGSCFRESEGVSLFYELDEEFALQGDTLAIPTPPSPPQQLPQPPTSLIIPMYAGDSISDFIDFTINNQKAYVVYSNAEMNHRLIAKYFDGKGWSLLGKNPISNDHAYWTSIETVHENPVVFYVDRKNNYSLAGKMFNNNTWQDINVEDIPKAKVGTVKTQKINNKIFLAYTDVEKNKIYSAIWHKNKWQKLPQISQYSHKVVDIDIININEKLYLAIIDASVEYTVVIYELNSNTWKSIGNFALVDYLAGDLSLASDRNKLYISYITYRDNKTAYKVNVKAFDGIHWRNVGNAFSTSGKARFSELQIYNSNLFLAYADLTNKKPRILHLRNNNWQQISQQKNAIGNTSYLKLLVYKNFVYIAYIDEANNHRPVAMSLPSRKLL